MATLTVRNVEDEIVRALKRRATEASVPVAELHRRILRRGLLKPRWSGAELAAVLRRLGELGLEIEPDRRFEPPQDEFLMFSGWCERRRPCPRPAFGAA